MKIKISTFTYSCRTQQTHNSKSFIRRVGTNTYMHSVELSSPAIHREVDPWRFKQQMRPGMITVKQTRIQKWNLHIEGFKKSR